MQLNSYSKILFGLTLLLVITAVISLGIGRYSLSVPQIGQILWAKATALEIDPVQQQVIFQVRLPRILTALCVGAGLALSGVVLQGIFRNPLVDPHIIGVTSGSAFGGTLAIFFGFSLYGLFASTILFGFGTLALVFLFSFKFNQRSLLMLILTGMILSGLFSALVSLLQYISDTEEKLPSIVFWLMGSFATSNWEKFAFFFAPFLACSSILLGLSWRLNLLSLDEKEAKALGVVAPLRWLVIFLSGSLVACQVAISGSIGWVGLIIPHLSRMLVGANHQRLLPCTMLIGATYMLLVDNVARSLSDAEIPISILTALIGAPLFGVLIYKLKRGGMNE
ncbi:molybdate ABC transporter permease MolB [Aggregatibacter kilianii]|uniref:molybdate ABC transporter permease MolB n=1 Tax=Aggregatibacter kilianii TaxID=2025884 RepID=UPI0028D396A0|nr:molybdate ABC transporter permease MolB [Aggregatibacter kilianii]